jgi:hypothetical protein
MIFEWAFIILDVIWGSLYGISVSVSDLVIVDQPLASTAILHRSEVVGVWQIR